MNVSMWSPCGICGHFIGLASSVNNALIWRQKLLSLFYFFINHHSLLIIDASDLLVLLNFLKWTCQASIFETVHYQYNENCRSASGQTAQMWTLTWLYTGDKCKHWPGSILVTNVNTDLALYWWQMWTLTWLYTGDKCEHWPGSILVTTASFQFQQVKGLSICLFEVEVQDLSIVKSV
jgi:hypothetical protein